ncbi:phage protein NinX family protein [Morganella morganii]|nr:DUF2591 domain-containing protein [Morganella morganii]
MNKYSDKSDFEINKAVAEKLKLKYEVDYGMRIVVICGHVIYNPCLNPSQSMPIIKDNLISLEHDGIAWQVSCVRHPEISVWDGCENYNDNFYRKAMELFLLMKDAENENNNNS